MWYVTLMPKTGRYDVHKKVSVLNWIDTKFYCDKKGWSQWYWQWALIIIVGRFDHTSSIYHPFSVVVLLLSIQLINITTASSCKVLLLLLLILLLSDMSRVAPVKGWVLTVGLGIVTQLSRIVPLLVRISIAPVLVLLLDMLTLAARVVALLLMLLMGWVVVWLGGGWVVLQQVGWLSSPKFCQFIPVHLEWGILYEEMFCNFLCVKSQPGLDPLIIWARRRRVQIQILIRFFRLLLIMSVLAISISYRDDQISNKLIYSLGMISRVH